MEAHLWGRRPVGKNAVETAVAVTYGRLLLPSPDDRWLWPRLAVYASFRMVLLSGDLPNMICII